MNLISANRKPSVIHYIGLFTIFCLGLFSIFPPIRALSFFNQLWVLCVLGWLFSVFLSQPWYLLFPNKYRFVVYIYIAYTIAISYIAGNGNIGNRFFELSQLPIFFLAFENNRRIGRNKDNLKILKWLLPFVLFTCFQTLNAYRVNPNISRELKSSLGLGKEHMSQGVGGYEFIYFLIFVVCILLFSFKSFSFRKRKRIAYVFFIFIIVLFSVNIAFSNFSTALLLLVIALVSRVLGKKISSGKLLIIIVIAFLVFNVLDFIIYSAIDFYVSNFQSSLNAQRMLEIKAILDTNEVGFSLGARFDTFEKSINVFLKNPLFGIIVNPLDTNIQGEVIGFGQHSQILDTFALFGAVIGFLQIYVYFSPLLQRIKIGRHFYNNMTLTTVIILIVVSTFNNVTPSIGLAAFFIFPTINEYLNQKNV